MGNSSRFKEGDIVRLTYSQDNLYLYEDLMEQDFTVSEVDRNMVVCVGEHQALQIQSYRLELVVFKNTSVGGLIYENN